MYYGKTENLRARKAITDVFFILLAKKPFSNITITDIIKKSGVARSTYYHNFYNKEEIIDNYIRTIYEKLLASKNVNTEHGLPTTFTLEKFISGLKFSFQELSKNKERILLIYSNGFSNMIQKMLNEHAKQTIGNFTTENHYQVYFIAGAMQNVLLEWLESGANESPEEMADFVIKLLQGNDLSNNF
jgi:AcrR family transcriptional regulator